MPAPVPLQRGRQAEPHVPVRTSRRSELMRKQTLAGLCFALSLAIVYGLRLLARSLGVNIPLISYAYPLVVSCVLAPLLLIPMSKLNRHLRDWRKARGRDIEEEEKYENVEAGVISLRPLEAEEEGPGGR